MMAIMAMSAVQGSSSFLHWYEKYLAESQATKCGIQCDTFEDGSIMSMEERLACKKASTRNLEFFMYPELCHIAQSRGYYEAEYIRKQRD